MSLVKFTAHIFICVSISLSVSGDLIISASAAFAQERRPLSVENVEHLMKEVPSHGRIAQLIQQNGVNFEATAAVRTRLKSAGAGAEVMEAVEKASAAYVKARAAAQPPTPAVEPERAKLEEENRKRRETLLKDEAKKKEQAERAKLEEEKRKLRETLLKEEAKKKEEAERARLEEENRKLREALKRAEAPKIAPAVPPPPPPPQTSRDGAEMVSVPAGEFWMGSDEGDAVEKPRRRVYLDAFRIDKFEVTNALYRRFMESTGRAAPSYWNDAKWNEPQQPVVGVSWNDAEVYCSWAGKRLPTEAEWEKAARGTDGRKYPWGEQWDGTRANSAESKIGKTVGVGSNPNGVSPYGAHDLAGNVWEWVADWYDESSYGRAPGKNPKGPDSGQYRVLRGGSWDNGLGLLRTSGRGSYSPADRNYYIGFRCAR